MSDKIEQTAVRAARHAGRELSARFKRFDRSTIKLKSHHEILTAADLASEKLIIAAVRKNFPQHKILSEEAGKIKGRDEYLWVIDPLDGTTNFSMHSPLWSVSIAVAFRGEIILGVVYAPELREFYLAKRGRGAKRNGRKIAVSGTTGGKELHTFCHGRRPKNVRTAIDYYASQKTKGLDCRQLGSAAIELAFVAGGRIESITIPGANPWDVAAGVLLVREAGGKVTDFSGRPWNLRSPDMLASNGRVHKKILRTINACR